MINLSRLIEGQQSFGCVMARLDEESSNKILGFNHHVINENIIYNDDTGEFGREKTPHITIKYGLTELYNEDSMKRFLHKVTPFPIQVRGLSIFECEKYDVVKFDIEGKELRQLNEMFSKLPNQNEHPDYHPHMTLAYVQKGYGNKFIKPIKKFAQVPIKMVEYSMHGIKSYYNL